MALGDLKFKIADDLSSVTFNAADAIVSTAEIDDLIRGLSSIRARLKPEHPNFAPKLADWQYHRLDTLQFSGVDNAEAPPVEAGFAFLTRSPGLGWCIHEVRPEEAKGMLAFLLREKTPAVDPKTLN